MNANNNLDVVRHGGRVYLAFRTGASHFAGEEVAMVVVSSTDEIHWSFETRITMGHDLREPRFLSWNGRLFLYFAMLGKDPLAFEPKGFRVTELTGAGWTSPVDCYLPGFIPWRTKVERGAPYMITYVGGENIYQEEEPEPIEVHWLTTDDGLAWRPTVAGQPVVQSGGGSETDFVPPRRRRAGGGGAQRGGRRPRLGLEDLPRRAGGARVVALRRRSEEIRFAAALPARRHRLADRAAQPDGGRELRPLHARPHASGADAELSGGVFGPAQAVQPVEDRVPRP
jgi:hypothetical protein